MKVAVEVALRPIRVGVEARAERFGLVGHGLDEEDAIDSIASVARAWCLSLFGLGVLPTTLKRRGIDWEGDPKDPPRVEVRVTERIG